MKDPEPKYIHKTFLLGIGIVCILILLLNVQPVSEAADLSYLEAENLHPISSIDPRDEDYSDLQFLKPLLKDKQIIVLGESLHSDGSAFLAKTRMIKFLHRELGFNTLFFELGRYDMHRLQNDTTLSPESAVYPFWCRSLQTQELWRYIKNNNIALAGCDIQCTGDLPDSLRRDLLFNYLSAQGINAPGTWPAFYRITGHLKRYSGHPALNYYIKNHLFSPDSIYAELDSMVSFLHKQVIPDSTESGFSEKATYISYLKGIKNLFQYVRKYEAGETGRLQWRDSLMAENFIEMMNLPGYKDKKTIVWISNLHAFCNNRQFHDNSFVNWGERVSAAFGDKIYTVLYTSGGRSDTGNNYYSRSKFSSLEYALHEHGKPYLYVSNMKNKSLNPVNCRVNQGATYLLHLGPMADGLFFIDTMRNVSYPGKIPPAGK